MGGNQRLSWLMGVDRRTSQYGDVMVRLALGGQWKVVEEQDGEEGKEEPVGGP